jgi:hypothetical protein
VNLEEAAAVQALLDGGSMTPEAAAVVLSCWVCHGELHPMAKPYQFRCFSCSITIKPTDIGSLQAAIRKRVAAALALNGATPAMVAAAGPHPRQFPGSRPV